MPIIYSIIFPGILVDATLPESENIEYADGYLESELLFNDDF